VNVDRICERDGCTESLAGRRATCRHCTVRCRVAAYRASKAQEAQADGLTGTTREKLTVTLREAPVTLTGLYGGPCPDPNHCRYRWRHASGPWTCEYNHPRAEPESEAA
jgi:hypothetical protein